MGNDPGFYGPLGYSAWLPWAGLGLLLLVAAWLAYVVLSTRQRPGAPAAAPSAPPDPSGLKGDYLRRIDGVEAAAAAGRLSARASHQELSLLIRSFVRDVTGIEAPRMTLAELNQQSIPSAALAVSSLYPAEFGPGLPNTELRDTELRDTELRDTELRDTELPNTELRDTELRDSVAVAAETAREVVRTWN